MTKKPRESSEPVFKDLMEIYHSMWLGFGQLRLRSYSSRRKGRNIQATKLKIANRCYTLIKKSYSFFCGYFSGQVETVLPSYTVNADRGIRSSLVQKPNIEPLHYRYPFHIIVTLRTEVAASCICQGREASVGDHHKQSLMSLHLLHVWLFGNEGVVCSIKA